MSAPDALFQAALARHQAGDLPAAEAMYAQVLAAQPRHAGALGLLGAAYVQRAKYEQALAWLNKALKADARQPPVLNNKGYTLFKLRRLDEALAAFDAALALKPDYAEALNNRGNVHRDRQDFTSALADVDRALALKPNFAEAVNNRGNILHKLDRLDEALAHYERAIALKPGFAMAHFNRGALLMDLGRHDEAGVCFDRAMALDPAYPDAPWAKAMLHLLRGEYAEGWKLFEWRWAYEGFDVGTLRMREKLWLGQTPLAGKSIMLHAEQGFGDTIQFARYARLVAQQAARTVLVVQPELAALMAGLDAGCEVIAAGGPPPVTDLYCPLMSLPLAFKTTVDTIPARTAYLRAPADKVSAWAARLGEKRKRRIGLVWSGRPTHRNDAHRSVPLRQLSALLQTDAEFHCLQAAIRDDDRAHLGSIIAHDKDLRDFADTAALVTHMDLVISVDTSVAHLSGALGKPVWILLPFAPDYRWMLHRADTPWYPTAKLLRQPRHGDWASVMETAAGELGKLL